MHSDLLVTKNLDQLIFDPENPRLPKKLHNASDELVFKQMLYDESLLELMGSITESGFFAGEPLLIIKDTNAKDKFVVVEGNRRLAALKLIRNPHEALIKKKSVLDVVENAKYTPTDIPCVLFHNKSDVTEYLGYRHITGIKEWSSIAKARYLTDLYKKHVAEKKDSVFTYLAKIIGSNGAYVARLVTGLRLVEHAGDNDFYSIKISEDDLDFSLLTTAISYMNISNFIGLESIRDVELKNLNKDNFENLFKWIFKENEQGLTVLRESRNLKHLNKILEYEHATRVFCERLNINDALAYTDEPDQTFKELVLNAKKYLEMSKGQATFVINPRILNSDIYTEIKALSIELQSIMKGKIDSSDGE